MCCVNFQRFYFYHFITVSEDFPSTAKLCSLVTIIILLTILYIYM